MYRLIITVLLISVGMLPPSLAERASAGETLSISTINNKVKKFVKRYQPLAQYLEDRLARHGVDAVDVSIRTDRRSMIEGLRDGSVDIYVDSPLILSSIASETGLRPALRSWKKGVAEYHSVIFTRANSGLSSISDLQGHVIAFEEPTSTSGYLLPKAELVTAGFRVVEAANSRAKVPIGAIGYVFSTDDNNTTLWIMKNKVAAGVVDSETFKRIIAKRRDDFEVIHRSQSVPRHVVGYRAGLSPSVANALSNALKEMHKTEAGRKVLKTFKSARFDDFPDGVDATFSRVNGILAALDSPLTD
jgi:phosphonate transport system substrate-binding protein